MSEIAIEEQGQRVMPGHHLCPTPRCGRVVADMYDRCYGCQAKWKKTFDTMVKGGCSKGAAIGRADERYPRRVREDGEVRRDTDR